MAEASERRKYSIISLWSVLTRCVYWPYLCGLVLWLVRLVVVVLLCPLLLQLIIQFIKEGDQPVWRGYIYVIGLFITNMVGILLFYQGQQQVSTQGW